MRHYPLFAMTFAMFLIVSGAAHAKVQCTCPKVPASGEGNTSCSAAESNNKCTVDFNVFFEREARAAQMLTQVGGINVFTPDPSKNVFLVFQETPPPQIRSVVILYLFVAYSGQPNPMAQRDDVRRKVETLQGQSATQLIDQAFNPREINLAPPEASLMERPPVNPPTNDFGSGVVGRISMGCIEVTTRNIWVMFKAAWSSYRLL